MGAERGVWDVLSGLSTPRDPLRAHCAVSRETDAFRDEELEEDWRAREGGGEVRITLRGL